MTALMALIFMALVFFTLYEQTYGSWVTFTDRMLTKDVFPSLVIREGTPWPWSTVSLLLAPLAFVVSARLSDRRPDSRVPKALFAGAVLVMLVFLLRDCVVLPQTAGSLTYLGALFLVLLAPLFARLWSALDRRGLDRGSGAGRGRGPPPPPAPPARWPACGGWCWPTWCWRSARCAWRPWAWPRSRN
jgi:POT family proton-dependent oligopeptide transporter